MRKLCWFALGFVLAVLAMVLMLGGRFWWLGGIAVLLSVFAFLLRRPWARRAAITLLGLGFGMLWCGLYQGVFLRPLADVDGSVVPVEAVALEAPRETRYGGSVLVQMEHGGRRYRAVLYFQDQTVQPEAGDRISCNAKLVRGEEKDDTYYSGKGVWLVGTVKGAWTVTKGGNSPASWPGKLSAKLGETAACIFPADVAGFLRGLLLGARDGMDYAQRNELSIAGIYHAVAVSGMHVSILFGMILILCGGNRRLAAAIGLPVVAFFVVMTGAAASSVRAGCMLALLMLAPLAGREDDPPTSIAAVLFVLLVANPWAILDIGLQLSFASTAGILLFSGKIYRSVPVGKRFGQFLGRHRHIGWLLRAVLSALCCSLASMVFSLPLTAVHFGTVSLAALLVNPLCLWAVSILFTGGLVLCLTGLFLPGVGAAFGWILAWLARYVLGVVHLAAKLPFAAVYLNSAYCAMFAVALYGLVILIAVRPEAVRKWEALAAAAVCFGVCLGCAAVEYRAAEFTFTMLDVGQGQCLVYRSGGRTTVVDCGGVPDEAGETAARYLQSRCVFRVDDLVLTHFDSDHVNGALQLLRREKVGTLWLPDVEDGDGWRARLEAAAKDAGCRVEYVREDCKISEGVTLFAPVSGKNDNDSGVCCLASAGEYDILITGDLSKMAEYRVLARHELPDIELLVAGHHGAKTSTSEALLEITQPETVFLSVGEGNRYGHPAAETLETIEDYGAEVFRTDAQGSLTVWR